MLINQKDRDWTTLEVIKKQNKIKTDRTTQKSDLIIVIIIIINMRK